MPSTNRYPSVPEPGNDLHSLRVAVIALKEAVELMAGQRGRLPELTTVVTRDQFNALEARVYSLENP
jgi:hypothetical protein